MCLLILFLFKLYSNVVNLLKCTNQVSFIETTAYSNGKTFINSKFMFNKHKLCIFNKYKSCLFKKTCINHVYLTNKWCIFNIYKSCLFNKHKLRIFNIYKSCLFNKYKWCSFKINKSCCTNLTLLCATDVHVFFMLIQQVFFFSVP